jgi:hypothetical protein
VAQENQETTQAAHDADQRPGDDQSEIHQPAKLLRIAHMVRTMLDEVGTTELDEPGRRRLADLHNHLLEELEEIVSDDLGKELAEVTTSLRDGTPSGPELRVAQAQLAGWLEGLFRGIQASMAAQQQSAAQQLEQMKRRAIGEGPGQQAGGSGQYL